MKLKFDKNKNFFKILILYLGYNDMVKKPSHAAEIFIYAVLRNGNWTIYSECGTRSALYKKEMILLQPLQSQFSCDTIPSWKFNYFISIVSLHLSYLSGGNETSIPARSLNILSYNTWRKSTYTVPSGPITQFLTSN